MRPWVTSTLIGGELDLHSRHEVHRHPSGYRQAVRMGLRHGSGSPFAGGELESKVIPVLRSDPAYGAGDIRIL
jgi:hypothetical protein